MYAPAQPSPPIWNRALVWSEHDAWMARRRARRAVRIGIAILVMALGPGMASYACDQLSLAAVFPYGAQPSATVTPRAPIPQMPPCGAIPPVAWFPTW